jgi:hypothetical protein
MGRVVRDVGDVPDHDAAAIGQRLGRIGDIARGTRAEPDRGTLRGQPVHDGPPDSPGAAGYQGPKPLQT